MSNADAGLLGEATLSSTPATRLPPALAALSAHLPGLAAAAVLVAVGMPIPLLGFVLIVSLSAAFLAWHWRLPIWWRYINLFFLPLAAAALYVQIHFESIDPNWFLAAFLVLALTSIGAVKTRVPLYLSSPRAADELALRLPAHGRLIDLGCGLGGPLARIHKQRPDARLAGIEAAPLNWLIAKLRLFFSGADANIRLGSLWHVNLSDYDIVYAYLSPAPMPRLWAKARQEMKPGSLFISNTFTISDTNPGCEKMDAAEADEIVEMSNPGDLAQARLLIWRL